MDGPASHLTERYGIRGVRLAELAAGVYRVDRTGAGRGPRLWALGLLLLPFLNRHAERIAGPATTAFRAPEAT
ncbi:MAG TPA: hypothetical protein VGM75_34895 [Pseudonocardiaceae bacterium]